MNNDDTITRGAGMSEDDTTMDALVQRASTPSLASLFKAGQSAGLIKPAIEYGHTV